MPTHVFQSPQAHMEYLVKDLVPWAGPKHLAMALLRRAFGRRRDAVRRLQRKHLRSLNAENPDIFLIGQKHHKGEWRSLRPFQDVVQILRKASCPEG